MPVVQEWQLKYPQSFCIGQVPRVLHHSSRPTLDPLNKLLVRPVERTPHQIPIFKMWPYQGFEEGVESSDINQSERLTDDSRYLESFGGKSCSMLPELQFLVYLDAKVLFNLHCAQFCAPYGIAEVEILSSKVQNLTFLLVKWHLPCLKPSDQCFKVRLQHIF